MTLHSVEAIEDYIADYIGRELFISPSEIDFSEPFGSFGMSSMSGVKLIGLLEDKIGVRINPTLIFSNPTIESLAKKLFEMKVSNAVMT
ncbi:hypothetical protein GCM10008171_21040 [Methylopila jiangsuensis]|uniref:Carrier domain-containing protein n=1 Tax=Methylopila jiangsuensis TaxID=586230 RepID=A0A9W6JJ89_9HYPH|nr:acyl carrier protein [Methylopila jiangsuensis]MDR6286802.1 phthiocerol/phenolphthiocerol synthesis type-I polyketide synthase D/polyketide synthase PksN [Methylopila jiangsuensis]GLK76850.1 hypothetical protein GCM10008171_21040 [Methylopila jiangsuensis]